MGARLSLAALLGIVLLASSARAYELEPSTQNGREILLLKGTLEYGEETKFLDYVAGHRVDELWLDSGGGSIDAAYRIGDKVREMHLLTRVPHDAICASACVDILLSGVIRFVEDDYSVGIHPGSAFRSEKLQDRVIEEVQTGGRNGAVDVIVDSEGRGSVMTSDWIRRVVKMGASMELVALANSIDARCMIFLSRDEMLRFNVVNTAPRPTEPYEGPLCKQILCEPDDIHPCNPK